MKNDVNERMMRGSEGEKGGEEEVCTKTKKEEKRNTQARESGMGRYKKSWCWLLLLFN